MKLGRDIGLVLAMAIIPVLDGYGITDSLKVRECLALYQDAMKAKDYPSAKEPLDWLLVNRPNLSKSLYIDGVKLYDALSKQVESDTIKLNYQDRVMELYHQRMELYQDKPVVYNHMANKAYRYYRGDVQMTETILSMLDSAIILNSSKVFKGNLLAYADLLRFKEHEDSSILPRYVFLENEVSKNQEFRNDSNLYPKYRAILDLFLERSEWSCDYLNNHIPNEKFTGEYMTQVLIGIYHKSECRDSKDYLQAMESYYNSKPTPKLSFYLAGLHLKQNNLGTAQTYYQKTLESNDSTLNSKSLLALSRLSLKQGDRKMAYHYATLGLGNGMMKSEFYELLGDLFFSSYEDCSKRNSQVEDRLCFIIAHSYYKKAGHPEKMKMSEEQFPEAGRAHQENHTPGESIVFKCWIEKKTILMVRKTN